MSKQFWPACRSASCAHGSTSGLSGHGAGPNTARLRVGGEKREREKGREFVVEAKLRERTKELLERACAPPAPPRRVCRARTRHRRGGPVQRLLGRERTNQNSATRGCERRRGERAREASRQAARHSVAQAEEALFEEEEGPVHTPGRRRRQRVVLLGRRRKAGRAGRRGTQRAHQRGARGCRTKGEGKISAKKKK